MNTDTKRLTEWVINKIKSEYRDDVALLISTPYASVNNDGHGEPFDYFIPATERGEELSQTFIIAGVGNNLYPRSWERTERTANLEDLATPCLADAVILYARSDEDRARFEGLRQMLFNNLKDPVFVYKKALENLDVAMNLYKTMMFEERLYRVKGLAGFIQNYLTISVGCLNHTYRRDWHWGIVDEVSKWKELPDHFISYYQAIIKAASTAELKNLAHLLITSTRQFIACHKPHNEAASKQPNYTWLADWYQELRTWWNRLYYFCSINDSDAAFQQAYALQGELDIVAEEFAIGELDLLSVFTPADLSLTSARAAELEQIIINTIQTNGITIRQYESLDEFLDSEQ